MDDGLNGVDSVRRMSLMLSDNDLEGNLASTIVTILEHSCSSYNFTCSLVIETFVSLIFFRTESATSEIHTHYTKV